MKVGAPPPPVPANPATPAGAECEKPNRMRAVTSGPLLDGLTMDDYYPGLSSQGFLANPESAGPWDTDTRCGVNVQLVGNLHPMPITIAQMAAERHEPMASAMQPSSTRLHRLPRPIKPIREAPAAGLGTSPTKPATIGASFSRIDLSGIRASCGGPFRRPSLWHGH